MCSVISIGVQQGDPLGPLLFCLVLHKVVTAIAADSICSQLSFHSWYIDDGVIAGQLYKHSALLNSLVLHWVSLSILPNVNCSVKEALEAFPMRDEEVKCILKYYGRQTETQSFVPIKSIAEKRANV